MFSVFFYKAIHTVIVFVLCAKKQSLNREKS